VNLHFVSVSWSTGRCIVCIILHCRWNIVKMCIHGLEVVARTLLAGVGSRDKDLQRYYYIEHVRFKEQILFPTQSFTDYCTKYMLVVIVSPTRHETSQM